MEMGPRINWKKKQYYRNRALDETLDQALGGNMNGKRRVLKSLRATL